MQVDVGIAAGRSGPKRLGSKRCSAALTALSLAVEAFTAVPHPRLWGGVFPHSSVVKLSLPVLCEQLLHAVPMLCEQLLQVRKRPPPCSISSLQRVRKERVKLAKPPPDGAASSSELR